MTIPRAVVSRRTLSTVIGTEHPGAMSAEDVAAVKADILNGMEPDRTSISEVILRHYGVDTPELHTLLFYHRTDRGEGNHDSVAIQVPEDNAVIDRMLKRARALKARVVICCDTREQADDAAARVSRELPRHTRRPLESLFLEGH
jgi:hypothetical protein